MADYKLNYTGEQINAAVSNAKDGIGTKLYEHEIELRDQFIGTVWVVNNSNEQLNTSAKVTQACKSIEAVSKVFEDIDGNRGNVVAVSIEGLSIYYCNGSSITPVTIDLPGETLTDVVTAL